MPLERSSEIRSTYNEGSTGSKSFTFREYRGATVVTAVKMAVSLLCLCALKKPTVRSGFVPSAPPSCAHMRQVMGRGWQAGAMTQSATRRSGLPSQSWQGRGKGPWARNVVAVKTSKASRASILAGAPGPPTANAIMFRAPTPLDWEGPAAPRHPAGGRSADSSPSPRSSTILAGSAAFACRCVRTDADHLCCIPPHAGMRDAGPTRARHGGHWPVSRSSVLDKQRCFSCLSIGVHQTPLFLLRKMVELHLCTTHTPLFPWPFSK